MSWKFEGVPEYMAYERRKCALCQGIGVITPIVGNPYQCSTCKGSGYIIERVRYTCPVCTGLFYLPRNPPIQVRCPHCNSLLYVISKTDIHDLKRGTVPFPPPASRWLAGGAGGALLGAAIGGPAGALIGGVVGALLGHGANVVLEAQEA